MHRSITLSMVSSTFSNNNNDRNNSEENKEKFIAKIGIGIIELLVSSFFLCYGILFTENVRLGAYSVRTGIWTLVLYSSARHLADLLIVDEFSAPLSRLITEYTGERLLNGFRYIICASTCFMCIGLILPRITIFYGIFGGVFSNLISVQLEFFAIKRCRSDEKAFEGNIQSARAISLMITPHFMLLLVEHYQMSGILLIFSAFLLNVIPAALILRSPRNLVEIPLTEMSRYHTLPAFSRQMSESVYFSHPTNLLEVNNPDSGFLDTNDEESECNGENEGKEEEEDASLLKDAVLNYPKVVVEDADPPLVPLTPLTVQMYYSNAGVTILPEIPEEPESTEKSKKDAIDPKRLNRISAVLEELNQKESEVKRDPTDILSIEDLISRVENRERIRNIEYIPDFRDERNSFLRETIRKKACCSCSPFSSYTWKLRFITMKYFCIDNFFRPLFSSITEPLFYPILITKVLATLTSTMFFSLVPYLAMEKNEHYEPEDTALLLSYMAFAWCLFLVFLPLLRTFQDRQLIRTFIIGLALTGTSMLLLTKNEMENDFIIWSCILYGCGYGMTGYTENVVYKSFLNERKLKIIDGCLETFSGLFVILLYYLIYQYQLDLLSYFPMGAFISYLTIVVVWLLVPLTKMIAIKLKRYFEERESENTFL